MTESPRSILVLVDTSHFDEAQFRGRWKDCGIEFLDLHQPLEIKPETIGAILQVHQKNLGRLRELKKKRNIPTVCFSAGGGDAGLSDQLFASSTLEEAVEDLGRLLKLYEVNVDEYSLDDAEFQLPQSETDSCNLECLVKARLQAAMYVGDRVEDSRQTWQSESYDLHIATLLTIVREPSKSKSHATLLDLASCVLAARLTKHFIRYRYKDTLMETKRKATPPGLSTPTEIMRNLQIGWDGLFTLVFSIVDFIEDEMGTAEFKFSELPEERDWVALIVNRIPNFDSPPVGFPRHPRLQKEYGERAKATIQDVRQIATDKWRYTIANDGIELRLYAPLETGNDE